ncbi:unnamed protein product [Ambrosiozyma monospora]|uniref:Unnamed protein product n=1 Tax=Ambrosiozyma monospora TaxID=43982 RepID=A0A9W7DDJ7_AMBMO|nr:unnamed protein product [Ambrosiozyma monospora]
MSLNEQYIQQRNITPTTLNSTLHKARSFTGSSSSTGNSRISSLGGSNFPMNFGLRFPSNGSSRTTNTGASTSSASRPTVLNYNNLPSFLNSQSTAFSKKNRVRSASNTTSNNINDLPFLPREKLVDKGLFPNVNTAIFPLGSAPNKYGTSNNLFRNFSSNGFLSSTASLATNSRATTKDSNLSQPQQDANTKTSTDQMDPETEFMNFLKYLAIITYRLGKKAFVWIVFILSLICSYIVKFIDGIPNPKPLEKATGSEQHQINHTLTGFGESTPLLNRPGSNDKFSSIMSRLVPTNLATALIPESSSSTPGSADTPSPKKNKKKLRFNGITSKSKISELAEKLNQSSVQNSTAVDDDYPDSDNDSVVIYKTKLTKEAEQIKKGSEQYGTFFFKSQAEKQLPSLKPRLQRTSTPDSPNKSVTPAIDVTESIKNLLKAPNNDLQFQTHSKPAFNKSSLRFQDLECLKDDKVDYVENLESSELFKEYQKIISDRLKMREWLQSAKESVHHIAELKSDQLFKVESWWDPSIPIDKLVIEKFNIDIKARDLKTLSDRHWLNDSVIDFYMRLLKNRSDESNGKFPPIHVFSTHFYSNLSSRGYSSVKKWAKRAKVDVTKLDYVFIPINLHGSHWALGMVDNKHKVIAYYDSLHGLGDNICSMLKYYMVEETKKTYGKLTVDYDSYEMVFQAETPKQENGFDCGVFTCTAVKYLSSERPLLYSQVDMPVLRRRMAYEIITGELLKE